MSGRPGRSGRRGLSIVDHQLRGTFRPDRHGPRAAAVAVIDAPVRVPEPLLIGLGDAGQAFLSACYAEYQVSLVEGYIIRLAGRSLDDEAHARANNDLKSARASTRQFLACVQRVGLPSERLS